MDFFKYKDLIIILEMLLIITITQAVVFMIFSYLTCGDLFLALRNFYNINYHLGV